MKLNAGWVPADATRRTEQQKPWAKQRLAELHCAHTRSHVLFRETLNSVRVGGTNMRLGVHWKPPLSWGLGPPFTKLCCQESLPWWCPRVSPQVGLQGLEGLEGLEGATVADLWPASVCPLEPTPLDFGGSLGIGWPFPAPGDDGILYF